MIFQDADNKWYFYDGWGQKIGPFNTREIAKVKQVECENAERDLSY